MEKVQIETFEFSLEERENKIMEILSFNEDCDSSDIKEKWSKYLRSKLPKCPFLAMVKSSSLENSFICDVINVEYEEFTAKAIGKCWCKGEIYNVLPILCFKKKRRKKPNF